MTHENENTEPVEPGGDAPRTYTSGDVVKLTVGLTIDGGEMFSTLSAMHVEVDVVNEAPEGGYATVDISNMDILDVLLSSIEQFTSSVTPDLKLEDIPTCARTPGRLRELAARMSGAYSNLIALAHLVEDQSRQGYANDPEQNPEQE